MAEDLKIGHEVLIPAPTFYPLLALKFHWFVGVVLGNQVFRFMFLFGDVANVIRFIRCSKVTNRLKRPTKS